MGIIINSDCGCGPSTSGTGCSTPCPHKHDDLYYSKSIIDLMLRELNLSAGAEIFFNPSNPTGLGKSGDVYFLMTEDYTDAYKKGIDGWVLQARIDTSKIRGWQPKAYKKGVIVTFLYQGIQHLFRAIVDNTTEPPADGIEVDPNWEILSWDVQLETRLSTRIDQNVQNLENLKTKVDTDLAGEGLYYDPVTGKINLGSFFQMIDGELITRNTITKPISITNLTDLTQTKYLSLTVSPDNNSFGFGAANKQDVLGDYGSLLNINDNELQFRSQSVTSPDGSHILSIIKTNLTGILLDTSEKLVFAAPDGGAQYFEDYSTNYIDRSLVDKAYVDKVTPLTTITEGVNTGQRLRGFNAAYFGDIGNKATDFTIEYALPNSVPFLHLQSYITGGLMGATGRFAFASGGANVASGNQAFACGLGNIATAGSTFVTGQGNQATGLVAAAFGDNTSAIGAKSFVTGSVNTVTGSASGIYSGYNNQNAAINAVILGGSGNTIGVTGNSGAIVGSVTSETSGTGSVVIGSAVCKSLANGASNLSSGGSTNRSVQSSIIASQSSELGESIYFAAIIASNASKIIKADGTIGGRNQAIIASDTSTINVGQGTTAEKWNNAIIAAYYAKINAGMSYNLTTGQGTIGTASAQFVCGMFNEDEPHLSVNNPLKKAFIVGGGGNSMVTGGDPSLEDRKTVFYIQHNGDMVNTGTIKTTQYKLSALNTAPASATAAGTLGDIRVTDTYIYVCTATNTWKRSPLTTW